MVRPKTSPQTCAIGPSRVAPRGDASAGLVKRFDRVLKAQDGAGHFRAVHETGAHLDVRHREAPLLSICLGCASSGAVLQCAVKVS